MPADFSYEWKQAIVTGGGTGLGRGLTLGLAAAGVDVWIAGRRSEPLEETANLARDLPGKVHPHPCDLRDDQACVELVEAVAADGPGILINNAAGTYVSIAEDITPKGWRAVIDASLNAPFYMTSAWGRCRIRDGMGGVILNVASASAENGSPGTLHSGAAKAGLVAMTKTLAVEWARHGIRVNAIAPGPFETPGAADWIWTNEEIHRRVQADVPLGHIASLDEIVDPALFLVSTGARYATGTVFKVDGGWSLTDWLYISPQRQEAS